MQQSPAQLEKGNRLEISDSDLKALDVIGWDVNYRAQIDLNSIDQEAKKSIYGNGRKKKYDYKKANKAMVGKKDEQSDYTMGFMWSWGQTNGSAVSPQEVPEPTSVLALFGTALLGLSICRKRA